MLYFIRHGSTDWNDNKDKDGNKDPKCQGRCDLALNQKGISQAQQTAVELKDKKFTKIYVSPLLRCKQTLEIVYPNSKNAIIDERIIERDFGEFEGYTRGEFDFNGFWNINSNQKFKKAESIKDVEKRVFDFLEEIKNIKGDILVVSHGGVGCVLLSYFKGIPYDGNYLSFEIPNGKPLIIDFKEKSKNVKTK